MSRYRLTLALTTAIFAASLIGGLAAQSKPQSAPAATTLVWTPDDDVQTWGYVSADGQLAYGRGGDLNLYVRDLVKKTSRRLTTRPGFGGPSVGIPGDDVWAFSPDGSRLAYSWAIDGREELRIIDLHEGNAQPRTLLANSDILYVTAWAWTPDAKEILAGVWRQKRPESELGLLDVATGAFRVLVRVPTAAPNNQGPTTLSPDGRFIAYSPRQQGSQARDVLLLPVSGGPAIPLLATPDDDRLVGWSRDGRELAFTRTVDGKQSIHAVAVNNDGTPGATRLLVQDLVFDELYGVTGDGSLVFGRSGANGEWRARLTSIDLETGRVLQGARDLDSRFGALQPDNWSRDGRQLVLHTAFEESSTDYFAVIRDQTGELRKLQVKLQGYARPWWSPDGLSLIARGFTSPQACCNVFRIDAKTGNATEVTPKMDLIHAVAADGRIIFERANPDGSGETSLIELDAAGRSRTLHSWTLGVAGHQSAAVDPEATNLFYRSPDRAAAAPHRLVVRDLKTNRETVLVSNATIGAVTSAAGGRYVYTSVDGRPVLIPVAGGKPIEIPVVGGTVPEVLAWATDGRAFLGRTLTRSPIAGRPNQSTVAARTWWVPIDGRAPRAVDAGIGPRATSFVTHGSQIAFAEQSGASYQPIEIHLLPRLFDATRRTAGGTR